MRNTMKRILSAAALLAVSVAFAGKESVGAFTLAIVLSFFYVI